MIIIIKYINQIYMVVTMITVSLIQEYLYCPLKVFMGIDHLDIQNKSFTTSKILSEGHIGFEELIKRNLWT